MDNKMGYRIYIDESGTHSNDWFIIGMLFVPNHGKLHSELCRVKEKNAYFNTGSKKSRYKETHFTKFRHDRDAIVGKGWVDVYIEHDCFFRAIVIDWSIYDSKYFGQTFEPAALKKRQAYKKWAELLIQPELKSPTKGIRIKNADLFLDKLKIISNYDIITELEDRFIGNYKGKSPHIRSFQHTESWKDANQCLQLCDLLTGCLYQSIVPGTKQAKLEVRDYLATRLEDFGIHQFTPSFWKGFHPKTLRQRLPKYSAWFWHPTSSSR